jgi:hypothetical protein
MRNARVAVLWIVAVALGVLNLAEQRRAVAPVARPEPRAARLLDVREADVTGVRLVDGDRALRLGRRGDGWTVVEPRGATVPGDLVRAFLDSLFTAVVLDADAAVAATPDAAGLDARRRIEIDLADGDRRVLLIGGQTPTGTAIYVRDAAGVVRIVGRNLVVYRDLLLDAAHPSRDGAAPTDPVA